MCPSAFCLQLRLQAVDTFYPNNIGVANVYVTVIRNPSNPQFLRASYVQNVPEYQTPGTQLLSVSATDPDGVSHPLSHLRRRYIFKGSA